MLNFSASSSNHQSLPAEVMSCCCVFPKQYLHFKMKKYLFLWDTLRRLNQRSVPLSGGIILGRILDLHSIIWGHLQAPNTPLCLHRWISPSILRPIDPMLVTQRVSSCPQPLSLSPGVQAYRAFYCILTSCLRDWTETKSNFWINRWHPLIGSFGRGLVEVPVV